MLQQLIMLGNLTADIVTDARNFLTLTFSVSLNLLNKGWRCEGRGLGGDGIPKFWM